MSTSPWDCLSCGAHAQAKAFCERCGAAQPIDGEDSALSMMLGLVCETCDAYNDPGESACASCGTSLSNDALPPPALEPALAALVLASPSPALSPGAPHKPDPPSWMWAPTGQAPSTPAALPKDGASPLVSGGGVGNGIAEPKPLLPLPAPPASMPVPSAPGNSPPCWRCSTPLELDDKFCRHCGARSGEMGSSLATAQIAAQRMPSPMISPLLPQGATLMMPAMRAAQQMGMRGATVPAPNATLVFGAATVERTAKLVLVRGQSQFGSQWRLQSQETVIGRSQGAVLFPDDHTMAPTQCKLVFRSADLWLEPAATQNGVFLRVRESTRLHPGDEIAVGAQRLRILADSERPLIVAADSATRTLGSLVHAAPPMMLLRIGSEPAHNEVFHRSQRLLTIGRNNCDLNFGRDSFVSERHAQLTRDGQALVLEDLRSRNGTYVRVRAATKLQHGDLILLGDKVLRVELPR